jgi:PAS domain S-box-containing protein
MNYNLSKMGALDIFLSSISDEKYRVVKETFQKQNIKNNRYNALPLSSFGVFMDSYHKKIIQAQKSIDLNQILFFAKKFGWTNNLNQIFSENEYEALIITDQTQKIIWVNDGFVKMTGYCRSYAKDKTPRFLQGKKTTLEARKRIKTKISNNKPFHDIIINHRKDSTTYKCDIKIFPLHNTQTTHFMALERKVL